MLLVRAKQSCALCTTLPSQCTLGDGRAACIGCALVGEGRSGRELLAYQQTYTRANAVLAALLRTDKPGTLAGGREKLRNRLGTAIGAYNTFAAKLVKRLKKSAAVAIKEGAAGAHGVSVGDMSRSVDAAAFADAAHALFQDWFRAESVYDGEKFVNGQKAQVRAAAAALYEPLAKQMGAFRARALLTDALGPFGTARDSRLGRLVPRLGLRITQPHSDAEYEAMRREWEEDIVDDDEADPFLGLFDPESDLIGAEAAQMIDASLLRRARDKLQQMTKGKRYNTARLEAELLKMFSADMRRSAAPGANAAVYASGIASDLAQQKIVANSRERGTREWPDFVTAAGNEFYRSDAALPPATCRQSQADFIKAHPGEVSYLVVADELVNMAAFFNKRAFEAAAIPGADDEMLSPTGAIKVAKTAEYRQVVQDLQRVRASLVGKLNAVCAEAGAAVKQDKPLDGKAIVDSTLLALFDTIWTQTVPHAKPDQLTFASIYSMYSRTPGTAAQRRVAMLRDFAARLKK